MAAGEVLRGWARSASGNTAEGIPWIEHGTEDWVLRGTRLFVPYYLALKAEALFLAHRSAEALEAVSQAEALVERSEERWCSAELHRLRGVFLAALGAEEVEIEASFGAALEVAKQQKSPSLATRAEETCAEYRRQRARAPGERRFLLPLG